MQTEKREGEQRRYGVLCNFKEEKITISLGGEEEEMARKGNIY